MCDQFGLPHDTILAIQRVFAQFPQIDRAIIYGSRVKGTYKLGSDIDLSLITAAGQPPLTLTALFQIDEALEELLLPYQIDLSIFAKLDNPNLIDHIERIGVEFFNATEFAAR